MRIAIDVRSLLEEQPSGVSEYTRNLLKHLLEIDKDNQYILFANCFNKERKLRINIDAPNVEVKFFHYPNKLFNFCVNFLKWPKMDKMVGGADVFIVPNLQFVSISKKCQKIVTVHDLSFEIFPQFLSLRRKLWHKIIQPKKLIQSADKVIAVSESTKNDLIDLYGIPENKIKTIYSGVDQPTLKLRQAKENYILSLATFEPRKNIDSLILAFEKLVKKEGFKDYKLILAGARGWKTDQLKKLVRKDPRIRVLGYVSESEKKELFAKAKLFVYPSFYEGFGFPPLEAMTYGTPVIASSAGSLPEVLENAALYVNPDNIYDILKAMEYLLKSPELQEDFVQKGFKQIEKYNWEKCAQETLWYITK